MLMIIFTLIFPYISTQTCLATPGNIRFTHKTSKLKAGTSFLFQAASFHSGDRIHWSVSNPSLATINKSGKLTAKKVGTVNVTASCGNRKSTTKVTITPKKIIGIDAGHQKKGNSSLEPIGPGASKKKAKVSSGTQGVSTRVNEYELNLAIAKKLKSELENRGYAVIMTRTKHNVNISNSQRSKLLNDAGCDIAIRLHADGSTNSKRTGASALYTSTSNPYVKKSVSKKSKTLAKNVLGAYCKKTKIKNNGIVVRDDLTGNNFSKIPTIVLEMGFMSNAKEDRNMQKSSTQKNMVHGIANGIDQYFK